MEGQKVKGKKTNNILSVQNPKEIGFSFSNKNYKFDRQKRQKSKTFAMLYENTCARSKAEGHQDNQSGQATDTETA